jgi:tRNA nucleotidyltransferase/poly(A) polymerase
MAAITSDPSRAREFARSVVDRLRAAGHEALWAGGCVRDELLGRTPADYDVATSAMPEAVRDLFGRSRTLAVGAAFGVITVVGPRGSGQVEVTTFRTDAAYTDGRHPAGVTFSTAADDAQRRDFTINGLFMDPRTGEVHDHVGGRADLEAGIVRAIGVPALRFGEDHLRMLRAVRVAAGFGFVLDAQTRAAIEHLAPRAATVSPERIAAELRAMLSRPGRGRALELLAETGLAAVVLPEVSPAGAAPDGLEAWRSHARIVEALDQPSLEAGLAILAAGASAALPRVTVRLRLSNREAATARWLRAALDEVAAGNDHPPPMHRPWSTIQPWLAHRDAPALADILRALAAVAGGSSEVATWVTACLDRPRAELDPAPLLGGHDLLRAGCPPGPALGETLARIRALQLDGVLATAADARAWLAGRSFPGP